MHPSVLNKRRIFAGEKLGNAVVNLAKKLGVQIPELGLVRDQHIKEMRLLEIWAEALVEIDKQCESVLSDEMDLVDYELPEKPEPDPEGPKPKPKKRGRPRKAKAPKEA